MITLIVITAVLVYLCRISGFALTEMATSPRLGRFLHFVPIAVFSALVVPSIISEPTLLVHKVIALATAGLVIRRTRHFGLGIIVGLAGFWLLT